MSTGQHNPRSRQPESIWAFNKHVIESLGGRYSFEGATPVETDLSTFDVILSFVEEDGQGRKMIALSWDDAENLAGEISDQLNPDYGLYS